MEGGHLVIGVKDKTLEIVGTDISRLSFNVPTCKYTVCNVQTYRTMHLSVIRRFKHRKFVTDDTNKRVWIIHIQKHLPRRPVLAHKKAWQRIEDSLVEMTNERMSVILEEPIYTAKDWSAEIVPDATIDDLDEVAIAKNTHQLPSYTKTKGLDKERLRQMVLQYLSNAGEEGAKRDSMYEYLKDVLPQNKTEEQKLRSLGDLLKTMKKEDLIWTDGRNWFEK